jgi:hypothetical protein
VNKEKYGGTMQFMRPGFYKIPLFLVAAFLLAACMKQEYHALPTPTAGPVLDINSSSFDSAVTSYPGFAAVLFYNDQFAESLDMRQRIEYFAGQYGGKMRFCRFLWDANQEGSAYGLEMLPTVVLYDRGVEIDRIKGIPRDKKILRDWNKDLKLWLLKNVFEVKGDQFSGDYIYRFRNTATLEPSNY